MTWTTFDHTGDIGIEVSAPALESLFAEAARAMFEQIADLAGVRNETEEEIVVEGTDPAELLRDWLAELLYRFSAEGRIYADFEVLIEPGRVRARARGERYDGTRHPLRTEIKAVTYHRLQVAKEEAGWRARVVLDV
ncbi:MAG: archease [Planctomycetes bacterium]|nr:archease [Planctomycetota bacterium]